EPNLLKNDPNKYGRSSGCPQPPIGLEPMTCGLQNREDIAASDSEPTGYDDIQKCLGSLLGALPANARDLIRAWLKLPTTVQQSIFIMIHAIVREGEEIQASQSHQT